MDEGLAVPADLSAKPGLLSLPVGSPGCPGPSPVVATRLRGPLPLYSTTLRAVPNQRQDAVLVTPVHPFSGR